MKRTLANLIPLTLLISATSLASAPPEPEMPVVEKDRFVIGVEAHFFRPSQTDLGYATGITNEGQTSTAKVEFLNPDFEFSGGRVFASYMFTNDNDIQISWMHEGQSDSDRFINEDVSTVFGVDDFQGFYGEVAPRIILDNVDVIKLKKKVDVDVFDLDLGHNFHDENYMIRIFAGLRYASIDDTLTMELFNEGDDSGRLIVSSKGRSHMRGIGPRGGFDARYRLMDHVSITGHAAVALLKGCIEAKTIINVPDEFTATGKTDTIERLVPNVDARLGLAVDFMFDGGWGVVIEGGFHADHFFDGSTIIGGEPSFNGATVTKTVNRDVSEYGPYLGVSILFS